MKKSKILLFVFMVSGLLIPFGVNAATANTPVGTGLSQNVCTSMPYQDDMISTSNQSYFSQCMKATCTNKKYSIEKYYNNIKVNCLNGNSDPYAVLKKNGCSDYEDKTCSGSGVKYCSQVLFYDCNRKSSGASFTTTTKTTRTTTRTTRTTTTKTTTTTTTTLVPTDARLMSLSLSSGFISFNPDVYDYTIKVKDIVNSIVVNAVPMNSTSEVLVSGNTELVNGSVITINVKTTDGKYSIYKINVEKIEEVVLSSNNRLKSLTIANYTLPFNSRTMNYSLMIEDGVNKLDISFEVEDESSSVEISGNENLQDGSKIIISVTAEDGSVQDYTIDIGVKKKSNILSIIFIIIVILALGAGGFYVYKKFFEGKNGEKYEYE